MKIVVRCNTADGGSNPSSLAASKRNLQVVRLGNANCAKEMKK